MGVGQTLVKRYVNHFGLHLKANDITRPEGFPSSMLNAQYTETGGPEKRKGYSPHADSKGGYGLFSYNRINPTTSAEAPEVLTVDQNLYKLSTSSIALTYSGAALSAIVNIRYYSDTDDYRCKILENDVEVLNYDLGKGIDETTPITVNQLVTAINLIAGFAAVLTGATTTPAAFCKMVIDTEIVGNPLTIEAKYWTQGNSTVSNPFSSYYAVKYSATDLENVSGVQLQNCMYFGNGYDEIHKYDGQTFYRAGMPKPASISASLVAGAITGTNYLHKITHIQYDAAGNIIEGNYLDSTTLLSPAAQSFDVTVPNLTSSSGYNTNCAIVAGAQVAVNTITVDNGSGGAHTMKIGDTAYFYDSVSASYVERSVTNIAATTITVGGAAVTVADNAVISNNLRIAIYRSKSSGSTPSIFYLVKEIPNNAFASTQVYNDNTLDAALGAEFIEPQTDRSLPPKGKYLTIFQGLLVIAGSRQYQNNFYWSDLDGAEYFPADTNVDYLTPPPGERITAISQNSTFLALFTNSTTHVLSGTLSDSNYRIEQRAGNIGCVGQAAISDIDGNLYFWDQSSGPFRMANGQVPEPVGDDGFGTSRIAPVVIQEGATSVQQWKFKRITAVNLDQKKKWVAMLPAETTTSSKIAANSNSLIYVYDESRDAWLKWNNINMIGGMIVFGGEIYFQERRYSTFASDVVTYLYRLHNSGDAYDYQDHDAAIEWEYGMQWEALQEPSVLKKALEVKVFTLEDIPNNNFNLTIEQENNYVRGVVVGTFTMQAAGSGYGEDSYGEDAYGAPTIPFFKHELHRNKLYSTRLIFKNSEDQKNSAITSYELAFAAPYKPGLKK